MTDAFCLIIETYNKSHGLTGGNVVIQSFTRNCSKAPCKVFKRIFVPTLFRWTPSGLRSYL